MRSWHASRLFLDGLRSFKGFQLSDESRRLRFEAAFPKLPLLTILQLSK